MTKTNEYKFDENKHVHTLNGKRLHGATSVLKMWGDPSPLLNWGVKTAVDAIEAGASPEEARQAHLKKRDKAGDIGTKVHKELEDAMQEWIETGTVTDDHSDVVLEVVDWMRQEELVPYRSEAHLHSETLWTGGIVDLVATKGDKTYILDFKTSNTVQTKMFYQMGAYSAMYQEMTGTKADGLCIIHIPKGRKFSPEKNVYWRYDVVELEDAFKNILNVYKLDSDIKKLITY